MLHHALQQGQCKGSGLTSASLGCSHDVFAGQHHRYGLGLDRRHGFVTHFSHGFGDGVGQLQLGECHDGGVRRQLVGRCGHSRDRVQFRSQIGHA